MLGVLSENQEDPVKGSRLRVTKHPDAHGDKPVLMAFVSFACAARTVAGQPRNAAAADLNLAGAEGASTPALRPRTGTVTASERSNRRGRQRPTHDAGPSTS